MCSLICRYSKIYKCTSNMFTLDRFASRGEEVYAILFEKKYLWRRNIFTLGCVAHHRKSLACAKKDGLKVD